MRGGRLQQVAEGGVVVFVMAERPVALRHKYSLRPQLKGEDQPTISVGPPIHNPIQSRI